MVYITGDGRVVERRPWSIQRVVDIFWGFIAVVWMFIRTLIDPLTNNSNKQNDYRGGGGGPGGGRYDGRGPPPNRRIGRINTLPECNVPGGG